VYFAFLLAIVVALPAYGHPGKTDRQGGHKCYKECAEWDLYYAEYHLHDKDGKPVKVARKKTGRPKKQVIEDKSAKIPEAAQPTQPAAAATMAVEPGSPSLPWILLILFLLLFLVVRRRRKKTSDT
jgi:MYXO-CTERM domain-containing protein